MSRIARFAIRRPVLVIVTWAIAMGVLGLIGMGVEDKVQPTQLLVPGTEPARWDAIRKGHYGEDAVVLLRAREGARPPGPAPRPRPRPASQTPAPSPHGAREPTRDGCVPSRTRR